MADGAAKHTGHPTRFSLAIWAVRESARRETLGALPDLGAVLADSAPLGYGEVLDR